ncbi:MAG: hypothetical protein PHX16_02475 [Syntrophaceticus sp.]|jgi:hypothetical protein|nr:hypothetical protein [Syntrophaceticus sp.]MDD3315039.1 hypothetical protein [Syntrophaceticus sp.]MDD4359956.1 hypothetical protein [Syntrophaceticus sp.]MDD4782499.1 hypothetical protein [Syntrophaceticus sp.]
MDKGRLQESMDIFIRSPVLGVVMVVPVALFEGHLTRQPEYLGFCTYG